MSVKRTGASRHSELIGRRIAGYVLDEVIGTGGMGAIYGATSRFVKKRAAVKVMLGEFTEDPEVVGRFLQEAFVASAVDHPNVVEIWAADRFEEDGRMYILMPLIKGSSLEAICEQAGPLGLDTAASIAIQIAAGLDAVHELGVVHRDIKPENILITRKHGHEHFVTIVDFGVARLLAPHLVATGLDRHSNAHVVIGTAGNMAPEQAAGSPDVDARADIYSWGVVLYRMLTGRSLPQGEAFPRPRVLRPNIPRAWEDVIMASLELAPDRRPSSMKEAVKSIVAPLPNGTTMLATLAPNLARDLHPGDGGKSTTGAHGSLTRLPVSRRVRALPIAIALVSTAGVAAGIAGSQLAGDEQRDEPAPAPREAGLVIVRSSPWAKVWIDGEALGQTDVQKAVTPGLHRIRLVGPGGQTLELVRDVKAGETVPIRWDWSPARGGSSLQ